MRFPPPAALLFAAATVLVGPQGHAGDLLASAPINPAMFRDGEVRRSAEVYGRWTLVCDAILRLGHRFCSLDAAPAAVGTGTLALTISTGDDGRPAALLRLPFGLSLPFGVRVKAIGANPSEAERRVPVTLCSATACEAVWSLSPGDVAALRAGPGLRVTVQGWRFGEPTRHNVGPAPVSAIIEGRGFTEAVTASLQ